MDSLEKSHDIPKHENFGYLKGLIEKSEDNIVTLDCDIVLGDDEIDRYEDGFEIYGSNLIIDGNDHCIDINFKEVYFNVTSLMITFKNIRFKNYKLKKKIKLINFAGFIINNGGCIFENCTFENNSGGGLEFSIIKNNSNSSCRLISCNFINNSGRLIYTFESSIVAISCNFINNGNVIVLRDSHGIFRECTFENNGCAINNEAYYEEDTNCEIYSCKFINNHAGKGAAIYNDGDYDAYKVKDNRKISCIIDSCNFIENTAGNGGAIYNEKFKMEITNSSFEGNVAKHDAGCLWTKVPVTISKCKFANNSSKGHGNSIYYDGILDDVIKIQYCEISNENSTGNDIFIKNGYCLLERLTFDNRQGMHLVYNNGVMDVFKFKAKHQNNKFIYNNNLLWGFNDENIGDYVESTRKGTLKYRDSVLSNNKGFYYLEELINKSQKVILTEDIVMSDVEQNFYEGGIELCRDDLVIDGQNHVIDANILSRVFYVTGKNITLKNIKFKQGCYYTSDLDGFSQGGGVILTLHNTSLSVENCEFIDNFSRKIAATITNHGKLNMKDCNFKNNNAQLICSSISNFHILNLKSCKFSKNFAPFAYEYDNPDYDSTASNIYNCGEMNLIDCKFSGTKIFNLIRFSKDILPKISFYGGALILFMSAPAIIASFLCYLYFDYPWMGDCLAMLAMVPILMFIVPVILNLIFKKYLRKQGYDYAFLELWSDF